MTEYILYITQDHGNRMSLGVSDNYDHDDDLVNADNSSSSLAQKSM